MAAPSPSQAAPGSHCSNYTQLDKRSALRRRQQRRAQPPGGGVSLLPRGRRLETTASSPSRVCDGLERLSAPDGQPEVRLSPLVQTPV